MTWIRQLGANTISLFYPTPCRIEPAVRRAIVSTGVSSLSACPKKCSEENLSDNWVVLVPNKNFKIYFVLHCVLCCIICHVRNVPLELDLTDIGLPQSPPRRPAFLLSHQTKREGKPGVCADKILGRGAHPPLSTPSRREFFRNLSPHISIL